MADAATIAAIAAVVGSTGTAISGIIYSVAQFRESADDDFTKAQRLRRKAERLERRERAGDDDDDPTPLFSMDLSVA